MLQISKLAPLNLPALSAASLWQAGRRSFSEGGNLPALSAFGGTCFTTKDAKDYAKFAKEIRDDYRVIIVVIVVIVVRLPLLLDRLLQVYQLAPLNLNINLNLNLNLNLNHNLHHNLFFFTKFTI